MNKKILGISLTSSCVLFLDRMSKWLIMKCSVYSIEITSWLRLEKALNRGIVWGTFNYQQTAPFLLISVFIIVLYLCIAYFFIRHVHTLLEMIGAGLILAGGLSNIIDRFVYYAVIDFISCSYAGYHWPVFNVADAAIVIGAGMIVIEYIKREYYS